MGSRRARRIGQGTGSKTSHHASRRRHRAARYGCARANRSAAKSAYREITGIGRCPAIIGRAGTGDGITLGDGTEGRTAKGTAGGGANGLGGSGGAEGASGEERGAFEDGAW